MDSQRKLAEYAIWFILFAAGMVINPPAVLSGSDPLSALYMGFSFLCMEGGVILLFCALAAPAAVALTVLPPLVEKLRWVLAVPLLLELTVGATPAAAAADVIVLGFLVGDIVGIWGDGYLAFPGARFDAFAIRGHLRERL